MGGNELDLSYVIRYEETSQDGRVDQPFVLTIEPLSGEVPTGSYTVVIQVPPLPQVPYPIPPVTTVAQAFRTCTGQKYLLVRSQNAEMEIVATRITDDDHKVVTVRAQGTVPREECRCDPVRQRALPAFLLIRVEKASNVVSTQEWMDSLQLTVVHHRRHIPSCL